MSGEQVVSFTVTGGTIKWTPGHVCRSCRWWGKRRGDRWCRMRRCCHREVGWPRRRLRGAKAAVAIRAIHTGPRYGCVHWEAKV